MELDGIMYSFRYSCLLLIMLTDRAISRVVQTSFVTVPLKLLLLLAMVVSFDSFGLPILLSSWLLELRIVSLGLFDRLQFVGSL